MGKVIIALLVVSIANAQYFPPSGGGIASSVTAANVTPGAFASGAYTFPGTLTVSGHSAMGPQATIDMVGPFGGVQSIVAGVRQKFTTGSGQLIGLQGWSEIDFPANDTGFQGTGVYGLSTIVTGNIRNVGAIYGTTGDAYHFGSGNLVHLGGVYGTATNVNTGAVTKAYAFKAVVEQDGAGSVAELSSYYTSGPLIYGGTVSASYDFYAGTGDVDGGTITNSYAFYAAARVDPDITNVYSFWSDEQGVYRIKADNTFNSVYQAIPALYNPQVTKYTPGAANYERIVQQWNSNVAEIGTEAGGTGTLRAVRLLGPSVEAVSYKTATNCADSAGAAACGSAAAGAVVIDAGATTVVVSTTAVTANSEIMVLFDSSLGTRLSVTCNTTAALPTVSARTAGTSFTIAVAVAPITNPACYTYSIVN